MFRTFNMGIGMILICSERDTGIVTTSINAAPKIGTVIRGDRSVLI